MKLLPRHFAGIPVVAALVMTCAAAQAQTTAFTYQGKLSDAGIPANGDYEIKFGLADALSGGSVFNTLTKDPVTASDGVFTVELDYGAPAFIGFNRWIEVSVRPSGSVDPFEILSPRQTVTSTPYAIHAGSVNASSLIGQVTDANLATTLSVARSFTNPGNTFYGDGTNLTNLDADSVATGTLADTVLSSNVALRNGGNTFTGQNIIRNNITFDDATAGSRFSMRHDGASQTFRIRDAWSAVDLLSITKNGRVGIGTTNPARKLHVSTGSSGTVPSTNSSLVVESSGEASISLIAPSDQEQAIFFGNPGSAPNAGAIVFNPFGGTLSNGLVLRTDDTNRLAIAENGNVGIGTTNPGSKLTVSGMVETTSGGIKFPNGTVQTTAAIGSSTEYKKISYAEFLPNDSNNRVIRGSSFGTYAFAGELYAPIDLPGGARVTKITCNVADNVAANLVFEFRWGATLLASWDTSAVSGNEATVWTGLQTLNNTDVYNIRVLAVNGGWPGTVALAIRSIVIEWDLP
jgi:hypothetical protein